MNKIKQFFQGVSIFVLLSLVLTLAMVICAGFVGSAVLIVIVFGMAAIVFAVLSLREK